MTRMSDGPDHVIEVQQRADGALSVPRIEVVGHHVFPQFRNGDRIITAFEAK
jgi:hypothetical protein